MKTITQTCDHCKKEFDQSLKEFNRKQKKGITKKFCSLSCSAFSRNSSMSKEFWQMQFKKRKTKLVRKPDEFSPFKYYFGKCKSRDMKYEMDLLYLKELWERQNGICPYTKLKMILPKNQKQYQLIHSLKKASLDRIDSSKGYIKGNVEFVCLAVNYAKSNFLRHELIEFLQDTFSVNQVQPT